MLRLMHPMIPFITETIWWKLNEVRPHRGLAGKIDCPQSPRLVKAAWPKVGPFDESAETTFPKLQEIIKAIRNARNDYKADPKKPLAVSIAAPGDMPATILDNRQTIELLASCTIKEIRADLTPPPNTAKASGAGCDLFIEGLVDEGAEEQRQIKRREDLTRQIAAMRGRLDNAGYLAKAPAHLVEQTKQQLAEAEAELAKLN
jgi:valyl-tRNA synthetase